ncbi:MAG: phosphoribosylaminoimidazolecarboxamide formyltransferase / cyclohydrolase [Blastocatellia bacterium]|jgi:phosphoribosylaminoimidazolecarboxamide formyltransferase/IMP cyclohydrolase|nr:phosphoribosylaminoimidazolecarboxamide formyltransferase / cyclohydrolase [Blastocatellia bacterium]
MIEQNRAGLRRVRRALISVSDKTGIVDFAQALRRFDVELISTGGTAQALREAGISVRNISEVTGSPEMMDGRVKTLHPRIHGALLGLRDDAQHQLEMHDQGIEPIDLVVVNLYPFEQTIEREGVTFAEAIEQIDIGGPAMIRSAAKNFVDVAVVTSPALYERIQAEMNEQDGALSLATRGQLARLAFMRTALYDSAIFPYLAAQLAARDSDLQTTFPPRAEISRAWSTMTNLYNAAPNETKLYDSGGNGETNIFGVMAAMSLDKIDDLRYGENPHQSAALYELKSTFEDMPGGGGVAQAELLSGKEMSFNNYVDADAAWQLVCDFDETTCAIIKHTNPAGVGSATSAVEAYRRALETDPVSAFGGIVAFNRPVDEESARALIEIFTEVVIAPDYDAAALDVLKSKKNLRVLRMGEGKYSGGLDFKPITGGLLAQTRDAHRLTPEELKVVTKRAPMDDEMRALLFAWTVCKHTKSNAIVYAREGQTVGVGAGQMSRVDSVKLGAMRAQLPLKGSVVASDAFFPFRDGLDEAARHNITAIIQPGGSVRDAEVIEAANEHGLAMVFTGIRHFKH